MSRPVIRIPNSGPSRIRGGRIMCRGAEDSVIYRSYERCSAHVHVDCPFTSVVRYGRWRGSRVVSSLGDSVVWILLTSSRLLRRLYLPHCSDVRGVHDHYHRSHCLSLLSLSPLPILTTRIRARGPSGWFGCAMCSLLCAGPSGLPF